MVALDDIGHVQCIGKAISKESSPPLRFHHKDEQQHENHRALRRSLVHSGRQAVVENVRLDEVYKMEEDVDSKGNPVESAHLGRVLFGPDFTICFDFSLACDWIAVIIRTKVARILFLCKIKEDPYRPLQKWLQCAKIKIIFYLQVQVLNDWTQNYCPKLKTPFTPRVHSTNLVQQVTNPRRELAVPCHFR